MFGTFHLWTNADTVRLNSDMNLNLHLLFVKWSSDGSGKSSEETTGIIVLPK